MARDTSLTCREALHASRTSEAPLVLITIDHDQLSTPIRVTSDGVNTVSDGETFVPYPFQLVLPDDEPGRISRGSLVIDNVHRDIVIAIRQISEPCSMTIQIVLGSAPDTIDAEFTGYEFRNIRYNRLTVTGDLTMESLINEPYPGESFVPSLYPGLF